MRYGRPGISLKSRPSQSENLVCKFPKRFSLKILKFAILWCWLPKRYKRLRVVPASTRQKKWQMIMQKSKAFFVKDFRFDNFTTQLKAKFFGFLKPKRFTILRRGWIYCNTLHVFVLRLDLMQNASHSCTKRFFRFVPARKDFFCVYLCIPGFRVWGLGLV